VRSASQLTAGYQRLLIANRPSRYAATLARKHSSRASQLGCEIGASRLPWRRRCVRFVHFIQVKYCHFFYTDDELFGKLLYFSSSTDQLWRSRSNVKAVLLISRNVTKDGDVRAGNWCISVANQPFKKAIIFNSSKLTSWWTINKQRQWGLR